MELKKVDLSNYSPGESNGYNLEWFQILTYRETKFVIYGHGPWYGHLMDWTGMNIYHGRLPGSPVFNSIEDAKKWLDFQIEKKVYFHNMTLSGHHAGEYECSKGCDDRVVVDTYSPEEFKFK